MNQLKDKKIYLQISLEDYLNDVLGSIEHGIEKRHIGNTTGLIISMLPNSESICHIQFESFEGIKFDKPILWRIKPWRDSYLRWQIEHRRAEKQRKIWNIRTENTARFQRRISSMALELGLDISDPLVVKMLQEMSIKATIENNATAFKAINANFEIYNEE